MPTLKEYFGLAMRASCNIHRPGRKKDIFLLATARGGSTWMMEIIASQPGIKFYDEPVNIRRLNVQRTRLFRDWIDLMPDGGRNEDIIQFFKDLQRNRYGILNPLPFRRDHRFLTDRIVFKLHALEHMMNDLKEQCQGQVVYLLRHPIPTSLSRHEFPRLDRFLLSCHIRDGLLDNHQANEAWNIYCKGSKLEKGVLSWCFENLIPLRHTDRSDWLTLTYEELLINPEKLCVTLASFLDLTHVDLMLRALNTPAANIKMSKQDTFTILNEQDERKRRRNLVTKWKAKVTDSDERKCTDILSLFGIDAYLQNRAIAHNHYLHHSDTLSQLTAD